jgi:hypothetical protein
MKNNIKLKGDVTLVNKHELIETEVKYQELQQEILEEAFECFKKEYPILKNYNLHHLLQVARFGAKWQQEQDKNKYSEEEVRELFKQYKEEFSIYRNLQILNIQFEDWFEQVKKK